MRPSVCWSKAEALRVLLPLGDSSASADGSLADKGTAGWVYVERAGSGGSPRVATDGHGRREIQAPQAVYNAVMGVFHLLQGAAIVALSETYAVQVTASWLNRRPGPGVTGDPQPYFRYDLGMGVALFLFFSAAATSSSRDPCSEPTSRGSK